MLPMLRLIQIGIGVIAIGIDAVAIKYFFGWLSKTDTGFGHYYGPASYIIVALWTASAGMIGTVTWLVVALLRRSRSSSEKQEKRSKMLVIQGVVLLLLLGPTVIVFAVSVTQLPRARRELPVQRIRAGEASIEELVEALRSSNRKAHFWAVQELEKLGPRANAAVPALAEALEDPDIDWAAAGALAAIGPQAEPAIPALVEAIKREQGNRSDTGCDAPSTLSCLAGRALTKIGPASVPELITLLAHEDRYVRMTAATALGGMGPQAKDALPTLNEALNDEDELFRHLAHLAIERIESRLPVVDY